MHGEVTGPLDTLPGSQQGLGTMDNGASPENNICLPDEYAPMSVTFWTKRFRRSVFGLPLI